MKKNNLKFICPLCDGNLDLIKSKKGYYYRCESYPICNITRKIYSDELKANFEFMLSSNMKDLTWEKFSSLNDKSIKTIMKKHERWAS